jgi:hypothetical protein
MQCSSHLLVNIRTIKIPFDNRRSPEHVEKRDGDTHVGLAKLLEPLDAIRVMTYLSNRIEEGGNLDVLQYKMRNTATASQTKKWPVLTDGGKVVSPTHPPHFTPQKHY